MTECRYTLSQKEPESPHFQLKSYEPSLAIHTPVSILIL